MPRRRTRTLIVGALALGIGLLTALPSSLAAAAGTPSTWPGCRYAGQVPLGVPAACPRFAGASATNPNVGGTLVGVSADSPSDAWAVGNYSTATVPYAPFLARWNGTRWAKVASPDPGLAGQSSLLGVSALSRTDAWAVGDYTPSDGVEAALILHWNGARWSQVASPSAGDAELFAVSAVSASDVWAVGIYNTHKVSPLIEHWNGTAWSRVPAPSPGFAGILNAVSVQSATDAWAVGYSANASSQLRPLTLHWNGTRWTTVASPYPASATGSTGLLGVSAISPGDAWAAGYSDSSRDTYLLHWNGTRWTRACTPIPPKPRPGSGEHVETAISGISASSSADVIAAGWYVTIDKADDTNFTPFVLRWNGKRWTELPTPEPAADLQLYGTSVVSANEVWAVGNNTPGIGAAGTLVLRWDGARWTQVPSPY
jgi:hypothetical protein